MTMFKTTADTAPPACEAEPSKPTGVSTEDGSEPATTGTPAQRDLSRLMRVGVPTVLGIAGVALLAVGIAVTWGGNGKTRPSYSVPIAYHVTGTGTADITYHAGLKTGSSKMAAFGHEATARLPWRAAARVTPASGPATVTVQLGAKGGHASCRVDLRGREVHMATASGPYGRATCTAEIPPKQR
ncbi:hypothetical protein ACFU8W_38725 [Streptomyces sp. NPDC057565]|uniref:hypothetical protein n=1 Tax=Streptomyces sp. NPDC057565 TaxID=3346169 RepID=UPI0036A27357